MKNLLHRSLRAFVRYLAPHAGLGVFELPEFRWSEDPEDIAFLSQELPADWDFYGITLH